MARYSFSWPVPAKVEHKLRPHKQSFGKIATTVVLDKDENLLWSGLQRHRSCRGNKKTPLPILLATVYLNTGQLFFQNRLLELFSTIAASMLVKFKRNR